MFRTVVRAAQIDLVSFAPTFSVTRVSVRFEPSGVSRFMNMLVISLALTSLTTECRWGDGVPVAQPTQQELLTCTPAAAVGSGSVHAELRLQEKASYADAQLFTYATKSSIGRGLVSVAALAYGADGGCAQGAHPANASERDALIFRYLHHAGQMGVDLAVLPEKCVASPRHTRTK